MKKPTRIESLVEYYDLVEQYNRKGRLTNDYLQNDAVSLINNGRLFSVCGNDNAALLVQKDGFWRLYYYINEIEEALCLPAGEFVSEILFRSSQGEPVQQIQYLERCGFKRNLRRDLLYAKYSDFILPSVLPEVQIEIAQSMEDVKWAAELFNSSFDKWSGDYISSSDYLVMFEEGSLLLAKDTNGNRLGAFESGIDKGVNWLKHFAVTELARGKGVGKALLDAVIEKGHVDDNSRYMLWVQHQNASALRLYERIGFSYIGKSTISMIKI